MERDEDLRLNFRQRIGSYDPAQLVFVDESSFDRRATYRQYGWGDVGIRVHRKSFFARGRR